MRSVQTRLNRISDNYPAIPKISPVDAVFDLGTADAVKAFQKFLICRRQAKWIRVLGTKLPISILL